MKRNISLNDLVSKYRAVARLRILKMSINELFDFVQKDPELLKEVSAYVEEGFNGPQPFRN